jgi:hypothetical protein
MKGQSRKGKATQKPASKQDERQHDQRGGGDGYAAEETALLASTAVPSQAAARARRSRPPLDPKVRVSQFHRECARASSIERSYVA